MKVCVSKIQSSESRHILLLLLGILSEPVFFWQIFIYPSGSNLENVFPALTLTCEFSHPFYCTDSILDFLYHGNLYQLWESYRYYMYPPGMYRISPPQPYN